jgi:hypothetical protein
MASDDRCATDECAASPLEIGMQTIEVITIYGILCLPS